VAKRAREHEDQRVTPLSRTLLLAAATLAILPAAAHAATVKVVAELPDLGPWGGVDYRAAPGESNRLELFKVDDTTIRVVDPGATITPGAGCTTTDTHTVVCSATGFDTNGLISSNVLLGDMNDTANSHTIGLTADGGPGDDRLESSSPVAGTLNGGGGHDTLLGGTNQDTLIDGDTSGAADSDVLDGRVSGAVVSYENRTAPVTINLATLAAVGEPGENDVLRSINGATGGAGNDLLRGDHGRNALAGGPGNDRLYALGGSDFVMAGTGDDRVTGGSGDDYVYGEAGNDILLGGDGNDGVFGGRGGDLVRGGAGHDSLASGNAGCGPGTDSVRPSARDGLARNCESALFDLPTHGDFDSSGIDVTPYPIARTSASLTFETSCPSGDLDGENDVLPFRGTLTLKVDGHVIGSATIPRGRCRRGFVEGDVPKVRIPVALNARGRRLLSDDELTSVTMRFRGRNVPPVPYSIALR
jgi:hypothetical protein